MALAAAVFSSHMVLQRNKKIAVFGTGTLGEAVTVSIPEMGITRTALVREDGTWRVYLPPMEGNLSFTVTVTGDGTYQEFTDVVTGEVWLAGGQSNMEFFLMNSDGGREELENASSVNVRCYDVYRNTFKDENYETHERTNSWKRASKENSGTWSAVAYYAAKRLSERLGVTVGIIGCNLGGTSASCWMPATDLQEHEALHSYLEAYAKGMEGKTYDEMIREYDEYVEYHTAWEKRVGACYAENPEIKWNEVIERCGENRYPGPMNIKSPFRPAGTYETMLQRVTPYTVRGFWYYQGESDDHLPYSYSALLSQLIRRWRTDFEDSTLPFIFTQLPAFCNDDDTEAKNWCIIREAQEDVYKTVKNTAMNVILDCGTFANIHPTDKKPVGERMASLAMSLVYGGSEKEALAPMYRGFYADGSVLTLYFDNIFDGLELRGEGAGFELAGETGDYYPAKAEVRGDSVELTSENVPVPVRARYAWKNYPEFSLYGKNGLPAAPLRTERNENFNLPVIG